MDDERIFMDMEIINDARSTRAKKNYKNRLNALEYYNDVDFKKNYRFDKETVVFIKDLIEDDIKPTSNKGSSIAPLAMVCITLRLLAKGSYQLDTGAPVIITLPHMLGASNEYTKMIRGLKPDAKKHQTFVDVQHLTGTPLQGGKRIQFNMFLKTINRIGLTDNLTTVLMPTIWVEEGIQLNSEMVAFFKKKLINTLKTLSIIHWTTLGFGIAVAISSLIYYLVLRCKPEEEAPLK